MSNTIITVLKNIIFACIILYGIAESYNLVSTNKVYFLITDVLSANHLITNINKLSDTDSLYAVVCHTDTDIQVRYNYSSSKINDKPSITILNLRSVESRENFEYSFDGYKIDTHYWTVYDLEPADYGYQSDDYPYKHVNVLADAGDPCIILNIPNCLEKMIYVDTTADDLLQYCSENIFRMIIKLSLIWISCLVTCLITHYISKAFKSKE